MNTIKYKSTNNNMITLVIGPMFGGKTSYLLAYERRFQIAKLRTLMIKWTNDTRYSEHQIVSHNGESNKGDVISVHTLSEIDVETINKYDAFLIDEGQFFEDLGAWCKLQTVRKVHPERQVQIVISGLNGDYKQQPFQPIVDVIGQADHIIHVKSICTTCSADAPFTVRLSSDKAQTIVGGVEMYQPRCRNCLHL